MYNDFFRFIYFIVLSSPTMLLRDKDKYSLPVIKIGDFARVDKYCDFSIIYRYQ